MDETGAATVSACRQFQGIPWAEVYQDMYGLDSIFNELKRSNQDRV